MWRRGLKKKRERERGGGFARRVCVDNARIDEGCVFVVVVGSEARSWDESDREWEWSAEVTFVGVEHDTSAAIVVERRCARRRRATWWCGIERNNRRNECE